MKALLSLIIFLALTACASQNKSEIEVEKKAANETTTTGQNLGTTIHELIQSSKTLSPAQKIELEGIVAINKQRAEDLSAKSYKFRALLIKELLSGRPVNNKEIRIIKKDIQKIEAERLKNTFDTVEKISVIVSAHPENEKYTKHLIFMERAIR